MFRRRSAGAPEAIAQDTPGTQSPDDPDQTTTPAAEARKGRPTPKRREAEAGRYQPIGGSSRRPAGPRTPQDKAKDKTERTRKLDAMKKGEDWALNPKDKGPVRAFVRDYIDSRRYLSEYIMVFLAVLLVGIFFGRNKAVTYYVDIVMLVLVVYLVSQGFWLGRTIRRQVAQRFPGSPATGLTWYAMSRSMQMRRMRMPQPRVRPGAKI
ncbi:MAG TPA: DUF3043 domain-containing protein [Streptosporangiaceae bacterium]|nr:DUF3043 domain-containing protein [Streptosporangiaceae bacterium]